MSEWIEHPLKLEGEKILLLPLEEKHFAGLKKAGTDERIWKFMHVHWNDDTKTLADSLQEALTLRENKSQYPFTIFDNVKNKIIGSTRFLKINEEHKNLEIGWTWYNPEYWGKGYNEECKLLMLKYCFEILKTIRVQFVTSHLNLPSQNAIVRIGAKKEGVIRKGFMTYGNKMDVHMFSIIEDEWSNVRKNLIQLIKQQEEKESSNTSF